MDWDRLLADLEQLSDRLLENDEISNGESFALGFAIGVLREIRKEVG